MIKVLLVDDDRDTLRLLRTNLEREGYHVSSIADPRVAIAEMRRFQPDLVFLDVMLPGTDGLDICRQIRRTRDLAEAGLIIVSALDSETDRVAGLEVGADDYISKPFSVREVLARTRAVLRRRDHRGQQDGRVHWEHLVVDPRKHLVSVGRRNVELSALEFKLLYFLATNRGHVFSRDNLLDKVWGTDRSVTPRNVDVCIRRIREKIEPKADNPQYIQTIHGVGYRFGGDET
jgi:DNA-binding response OmpR family regulator